MTPKLPADDAARKRIANELGVTMMVEAAAGTGKTTSLVTRMVNLAATGTCRAPEMAAITFTRKAGAQLRERFQEELEKALAGGSSGASGDPSSASPPQDDGGAALARGSSGAFGDPSSASPPQDDKRRERVARALANLDRTFLGTTHAFCARLLRERPVEAGLEPDFSELDEQEARVHASEFWQRWWEARAAEDDERIVSARRAGMKASILFAPFRAVLGNPDVRIVWKEVKRPDLQAICGRLSRLLDEIAGEVPPPRQDGKPEAFEKMLRELLDRRASSDLRELRDQLRFLEEGNHHSRGAIKKLWRDGDAARAFDQRYSAFVTSELRPALAAWKVYVHGVALSLLVPAAKDYREERRRDGIVTFDDLLVRARDLLRDFPAVRRYFQSRYRVLLVDEFQDTDPVQAEILFYLTGTDPEEKNWRKLVPRAGSLFIVGDPKQSIYRFRRADITTYLEVRRLIRESGGEIVTLSTNFRSTPAICTFVNESFARHFAGADVEEGRQAEHVALQAFRDPCEGGVFRGLLDDGSNPEVAAREASAVAARIRVMVEEESPVVEEKGERAARWGDFLLIAWQTRRLRHYAEALGREGIPYEITGGKAFQRSEELSLLLPVLRAIVQPDDPVQTVAVLRGPLFGVDDDALYRFRKAGGRFTWLVDPPADADARLARGLAMLRAAGNEARELPPAAVIGRVIDRLGLMALAASLDRGETRSGNLSLALSYARHESAQGASLSEIVELLESLVAESSEIEELNIEPDAPNAVRLMNLHQVKGLEAPFVFLIDPADVYDFDVGIAVERGEENLGHLPIRWKRYQSSWKEDLQGQPEGWEALEAREKSFLAAEKKRLLYVAATRARQWLAIGLRRIKGGAWSGLASDAIPELGAIEPSEARAADARRELDVETARREIESARERAEAPSYAVVPITKVAHENQERLARAEEGLGKGTSWGRVMHRLFEALLRETGPAGDDGGTAARRAALRRDVDVALLAANLLKDEERDAAELDEVLATVRAVTSSPLWTRVLAADEVMVEVPFAVEVAAAELASTEERRRAAPPYGAGPPSTLLHGTVDLVFREGATWFVVDYKTDSTKDRVPQLVEYYAPQVRHYAKFWQQLTGAETTGGLFFVDGCIEEWV